MTIASGSAALASDELNVHNADGTLKSSVVTEAKLSLSDNTTADVSTTVHGLVPKAPNDATKYLLGDATWATPAHNSASSNVHGLPSGAYVVGTKDAAAKFFQSGSGVTGSGGALTYATYSDVVITFAVAFSSAPIVIPSGSGYQGFATTANITASGCTIRGLASSGGTLTMQYIAFGG